MRKHIIKVDHLDGVTLPTNKIETWCGVVPSYGEWLFQDAQHALCAVENGSRQNPCEQCLSAIIRVATQALSED
ncbi:hypothetical protein ECC98_22400 [Salmonella enterica subsp. enterica serovar Enteritidis]|nr:hypothetical protein [Salmonella enterica subsp. enterica serovar Enteritidis]